jgi:hypothetical protein
MGDTRRGSAVLRLVTFVIALLPAVLSCSNSADTTDNGGGTGVGNGVAVGKVLYADSTPVVGAMVRLRMQAFLADTSGSLATDRQGTVANLTTDSAGNFSVASLDSGVAYSIEVIDREQSPLATLYKIGTTEDTTRLTTRIVAPVKRISGTIRIAGLPANAYVMVYGLEKLGRTDANGTFVITDLPVGECEHGECEYLLRVMSAAVGGGVKAVDCELEVVNSADSIPRVELEIDSLDD